VRNHRSIFLAAAALLALPASAAERKDIPVKYTWNLADLYPNEAAWSAARDDIKTRVGDASLDPCRRLLRRAVAAVKRAGTSVTNELSLACHRGHLADSPQALAKVLEDIFGVQLATERLYVYATSLSDQDLRENRPRELQLQATQAVTDLAAATAFVGPAIIALGPAKVRSFVSQEKRLAPYAFYLEDTLRLAPHTGSASEEKIIAEAGNLSGAGQAAFSVLANADLPWPTVKLSTGDVRLDAAGYSLARAAPLREDRDKAFTAFFGALKAYEHHGQTLDAQVKGHIFTRRCNYPPRWRPRLPNAVPPAVYTQLVADVRKNLPTFHRYLVSGSGAGLSTLRYRTSVPMVGKVSDLRVDEASSCWRQRRTGQEHVDAPRKGTEPLDRLPPLDRETRRGLLHRVWGVHPYQPLNFNGKYDDLPPWPTRPGTDAHLPGLPGSPSTAGYPSRRRVAHLNEPPHPPHAAETKGRRHPPGAAGELPNNLRGTLPPDPVRRVRAGYPPGGGERRAVDR
jgi:oligoendopeptidase F